MIAKRYLIAYNEGIPGVDEACTIVVDTAPPVPEVIHHSTSRPHPRAKGREFCSRAHEWQSGVEAVRAEAVRTS